MTERVRRSILDFVRRYPAVHPREVERQLGLSDRLAAYHLRHLRAQGLVEARVRHGTLSFVPVLTHRRHPDWDVVAALRRGPAVKIALLLLESPELTQGEIARSLDLAAPSVTYHLRGMMDAGLVRVRDDRPRRFYSLVDPGMVRRTLRDAPPLPGALDRFSEMFDSMFSRR